MRYIELGNADAARGARSNAKVGELLACHHVIAVRELKPFPCAFDQREQWDDVRHHGIASEQKRRIAWRTPSNVVLRPRHASMQQRATKLLRERARLFDGQ